MKVGLASVGVTAWQVVEAVDYVASCTPLTLEVNASERMVDLRRI